MLFDKSKSSFKIFSYVEFTYQQIKTYHKKKQQQHKNQCERDVVFSFIEFRLFAFLFLRNLARVHVKCQWVFVSAFKSLYLCRRLLLPLLLSSSVGCLVIISQLSEFKIYELQTGILLLWWFSHINATLFKSFGCLFDLLLLLSLWWCFCCSFFLFCVCIQWTIVTLILVNDRSTSNQNKLIKILVFSLSYVYIFIYIYQSVDISITKISSA